MPHRFKRLPVRPLWVLGLSLLVAVGAIEGSELRNTPLVKAVQLAEPSVVNIHGQKTLKPGDEGFRRGEGSGGQPVNGMGTGVIIDPRGYILTNFHVVDGVSEIEVSLSDARSTHIAKLIARDPKTDLAIIKINASKRLPVITIGTSCDLMKAEPVFAIGNAYGYDHTVTTGIVSALHREVAVSDTQKYRDLIQTSAAINPGNSGGPLLNADGEMIGINVAVRQGAQGIAFAIPVDMAMTVATTLMAANNPKHGIISRPLVKTTSHKLVVGDLEEESPAAKCGLRPGDIVTAIGDVQVERPLDLERALIGHKPGEELELTVDRNQRTMTMNLALEQSAKPGDRLWNTIGLKLEPISAKLLRDMQKTEPYRGGLMITGVRPNSPAQRAGVHVGEILVGMHEFETTELKNVEQILRDPSVAGSETVQLWTLRDAGNSRFITQNPSLPIPRR